MYCMMQIVYLERVGEILDENLASLNYESKKKKKNKWGFGRSVVGNTFEKFQMNIFYVYFQENW